MITKKAVVLVAILTIGLVVSCKDNETNANDNNEKPYGIITDTSGCKSFAPDSERKVPKNKECVEAEYSSQNKILRLTHVNAGFNCCPGVISAEITIEDDAISIVEKQSQAGCRCNCLYDVKYELRNIDSGAYEFTITGPLTGGDQSPPPLKFSLDLNKSADEFCLERNFYPWE